MAVLLKIISFAIWMLIMMVIIRASRVRRNSTGSQRLSAQLSNDNKADLNRLSFKAIDKYCFNLKL
jgi:hypothetical protein